MYVSKKNEEECEESLRLSIMGLCPKTKADLVAIVDFLHYLSIDFDCINLAWMKDNDLHDLVDEIGDNDFILRELQERDEYEAGIRDVQNTY